MTLDEAIAIMEDPTKHTMTCSQGELTAWLKELKEAKRLLKSAVEDANVEAESLCAFCKHNDIVDGCPYIESYSECEYIWRYTDEVLKLIGEDEDEN